MTLSLPLPMDVIRYATLLARISGFLLLAPVTGSRVVPIRWRVLLCMGISLALSSALPGHWQTPRAAAPIGMLYLAVLIGSELLLGVMISLFVHIMVEMFAFAGHVIGINMGFAFAHQIDPTLDAQSSMISVFMTQLFVIVFVVSGGIPLLLHLAILSVHRVPPGAFSPTAMGLAPLVSIAGQIFKVGFQIALPIFCVTLFINVALGLMTRFGEEFQVLMLAFPVRIGVGFFIIFAMIPLWVHLADRLMRQTMTRIAALIPS